MNIEKLVHKVLFRLRVHGKLLSMMRTCWWRMQGAAIGSGTHLPAVQMIWPHQVRIGNDCILESGIFFKFDGVWQPGPCIVAANRVFIGKDCEFNIRQRIHIGDDCLIASGCKFIDHDHGTACEAGPMNRQAGPEAPIVLEEDVWLGVNVVVLKGVTIGRGAIVGAGAIVTRSIPPSEIWAGVPARKIGQRCEA